MTPTGICHKRIETSWFKCTELESPKVFLEVANDKFSGWKMCWEGLWFLEHCLKVYK